MSRDRRQTEQPAAKGEGGGDDDGVPMERFKNLTRRLLTVSNKKVQQERRKRVRVHRGAKK
jgi:hypothetical protein